MLERWTPMLLALAVIQLLLGGIAAVTVDGSPAPIREAPTTTVPFPPENPNPETPVPPPLDPADPANPADPGTGVPPTTGGGGDGPRPLPSSVTGDWRAIS